MAGFQVIEGGLSPNYNVFSDYSFTDCMATDTRLMGAVAMCARFSAADGSGGVLHILFHLDFSEYGIDEYLEYFHDTDDEAFVDKDLWTEWAGIYGGLGGELVQISPSAMLFFIDQALEITRKRFRSDDSELLSFRKYAFGPEREA